MPAIKRRRRLMGEINVVPYIDVMLVLLIIFMVTAPLLTQGVQVELPDADAKPIDPGDPQGSRAAGAVGGSRRPLLPQRRRRRG